MPLSVVQDTTYPINNCKFQYIRHVYTSHTFHVFHCSAPYFETCVFHCSALIGVITHSTCINSGSSRLLMTRNYTKGNIVS